MKQTKRKISVKEIALIGVMIATIEAAKQALASLPNVELVTLLIILYTLFFGKRIFLVLPVFVFLEGCIYGFGIWWIMYLYAWPLLAVITLIFRRQGSLWFWAIVSGFFGLAFGALCSIPYYFISGPEYAFGWWIAGIPFDIVHCISNFILCLVLFLPLRTVLNTVKKTYFQE